jgi:hypothetical protein
MGPLMACVLAGVVMVLILPMWSARPYEKPRTTLFAVGVLVIFGIMAHRGLDIRIPRFTFTMVVLMIAYWALVSGLSSRPKISWQHMIKFTATVIFGLFIMAPEWRPAFVQIAVSMAVLHSIIAILQSTFKVVPFKALSTFKPNYACGLLSRSPNILGHYLVPHLFLVAWLASTGSPLWLLTLPPMGWALWLSKCRGALLGTVGGAIFLGTVLMDAAWVVGGIGIVCVALLLDGKTRRFLFSRSATVSDRFRYWGVAMAGIEQMPLVGYGFDVIKTRVPFLQREINEKTDGRFLAGYHHPEPQKMHNDLIQSLLDTGPLGTAMVVSLVALAVTVGLMTGQVFLTTALISMIVCGLVFHVSYFLPINIVFWFLIGALLQTPEVAFALDPNLFFWISFAGLGYLAWRFIILEQRNDYIRWQLVNALDAGDQNRLIMKAMALHPASSRLAVWAAKVWHPQGRYFEIIQVLTRAIYSYDGITTLWFLWAHLSIAYLFAGAPGMAFEAAEEALRFNPEFELAKQRKEMAKSILDRMRAERGENAATS